MRVLWIKAGGLLPLDTGGKIRSYHTIKELAQRHEITLYTFYKAHSGDVHRELEKTVARVFIRPLELPESRTAADAMLFARLHATGTSYTMGKYYRPQVRRDVRTLTGDYSYDIIVCDFIFPAGLLPWSGSPPTVLFTHNVEAEVWERQLRLTHSPLMKLALQLEAKALVRAERRYALLAEHVLTVSERNADYFRSFLDPDSVSVVPTGVDVEYFRPSSNGAAARSLDLVFTGSMDWMPNEDAVLHFVKDILPLIRQEVPAVRFLAVGRKPSAALERLADGDKVVVTGAVDDIRPYLSRAAVFVVPIRSGSGTRLKVFEAMAAGKAVVSTRMGSEGLMVNDGEDIHLADNPHEFAAAVVSLLRDPGARASLESAARRLVEERYSWRAATVDFEAVLKGAARRAAERISTP